MDAAKIVPAAWWFFGRSGAGKTTLANGVAERLRRDGLPVFIVDGDELRGGLCNDLGFDDASRTENHRRAAEVALLALSQGFTVLGATMCPLPHHRHLLKTILGSRLRFIHVSASHELCATRDNKGLYHQATQGRLEHFNEQTFHLPRPEEADLVIETGGKPPSDCIEAAWQFVVHTQE